MNLEDSKVIYNGIFMRNMSMFEIDKLLTFLRLDKSKIELTKVGITYNDEGIKTVDLVYYDLIDRNKSLKRCIIGINGAKINELTPG